MRTLTVLMTREEAEFHVNAINNAAADMGRHLLEMKKHEGWRVLGYATWTAFLDQELSYSRRYLYELMNAAPVLERLGTTVHKISIKAATALARYDEDLQPVIVRTAQARYGELTESNVARVGNVVQEMATSGHVDIGNGTSTPIDAALTIEDEEAVKRSKAYIHENGAKPKSNYSAADGETHPKDFCQTPDYALDPLLPYLPRHWRIWEPAEGEGFLVEALYDSGFKTVITGDIRSGQDYYQYEPAAYDCQITNPPFSDKYIWLERAYALGKPFALLMPIDTLGAKTAQTLFEEYGIEILCMNQRVDFKMPNKGWDGDAQFNSAWFCWQFAIGRQLTFTNITAAKQEFVRSLKVPE